MEFLNELLSRPALAKEIDEHRNENLVFILKPTQLNILGQVFRPILTGKITEISNQYIRLENVNIKMTNAPEYIFSRPLTIPLNEIVNFFSFPAGERFPLV